MTANENQPLLERYFRSLHPQINDEPQYPLLLDAEEDARLRARAEAAGADYDRLKRDFLLAHQIVSAHKTDEEIDLLLDKNAIPLDRAQRQFKSFINGAILYKEMQKPKA